MIARSPSVDRGLLLVLLVVCAVNLVSMARLDSTPPPWDVAVHLKDSLVYHNVLTHPGQVDLEMIRAIMNRSDDYPLFRPSGYYPPLVPLVTAFLYLPFGTSPFVAVLSNVLFLGILVFSTYALGSELLDRDLGLLSAFLVAVFPLVVRESAMYMLDLPLTAMVALGVLAIVKTEGFSRRSISVLAGVAFGLGMLTKWTFLFFVLGPLAYVAVKAVLSGGRRAVDIVFFAAAAALTFGPYYFPILGELIRETLRFSSGTVAHGPKDLLSWASLSYYSAQLWQTLVTPLGAIAFVVGLVALAIGKQRNRTFLWIWLVLPYLIFTLAIGNKKPRYMLPWLPSVALVMAYGIRAALSEKIHPAMARMRKVAIPAVVIVFALFFAKESSVLRAKLKVGSTENWHVDEIVSLIQQDMRREGFTDPFRRPPRYLGVIPDHVYVNGQTLRYLAARRNLPLTVIKLQNYRPTAYREFETQFDRYGYVLTKDGTNVAFPAFQEETNRLDALFRSRIGAFEILGTFREPDGSTVTLYKRTFKRTFKRTATPAAAPGRSDPRTRRAHLVPLS